MSCNFNSIQIFGTLQIIISPLQWPHLDDFIYSETCILRPPLGPEKCGLYLQVVFISRSILYMIRTVCSEKGGLKIQVVFLDSGHIIQVSLYISNPTEKYVYYPKICKDIYLLLIVTFWETVACQNSKCLSECVQLLLLILVTMGQVFMKLGGNVGTYVRLIVLNFHYNRHCWYYFILFFFIFCFTLNFVLFFKIF